MNTNNKVLELTFTVEGSAHPSGAGILFRPCSHGFQAGEDRRNQCDRTGITRNGTVQCLTSHPSVLLFTTYDYHKGEHYVYHV